MDSFDLILKSDGKARHSRQSSEESTGNRGLTKMCDFEVSEGTTPDSPCIGVCQLADATATCTGCYRTISEISAWPGLTDTEKLAVLAAIRERRAALPAPNTTPKESVSDLRIVSFLPSATEMACALGLLDEIVGVTHECDYPPEVRSKPVVVRSAIPVENTSAREIDEVVSDRIRRGESLYEVDERLLRDLAPTHILTQSLCQVCAPSGNEVARVLDALPVKPKSIWLTPHCIEDIFDNMRELGLATRRIEIAEAFIANAKSRLQRISDLTRSRARSRVFCLEWTDPYYCSGHWVPEMVEMAAGFDQLGRKGSDSVRVSWDDISAWSPEVLIVAPCGFNTVKAALSAKDLLRQPRWNDLPAVRNGRVFAVDANSYFARPGPRIVEGVELLAHLLHPEVCAWLGNRSAFDAIA